MIMINLLPHREERRQQRKKIAFFAGLAVAGVRRPRHRRRLVPRRAAADLGPAAAQPVPADRDRASSTSQIKDIASLKAEIASLKARQKAVEDLQIDRNVPVHLLNELVKQTPEGDLPHLAQAGRTDPQRRRHRADAGAHLRVPAQHRLQLRMARQAGADREQGRRRSRRRTRSRSACSTSRCASRSSVRRTLRLRRRRPPPGRYPPQRARPRLPPPSSPHNPKTATLMPTMGHIVQAVSEFL